MLIELQKHGYNIDIVNLTFNDLEMGVKSRLIGNKTRNHSGSDIASRVQNAIADNLKFGEVLRMYATSNIYTDMLDIEQTYQKVCEDLKIGRRK